MASVTIAYGTRAAYSAVSNLNSQASAAARTIGAVDATATTPANPDGFKIDYTIRAATTGVTSTGTVTFYLVESADGGTTYTDNLNVATTTDQAALVKNAKIIQVVRLDANSATAQDTFDLPRQFTPKNHTILVLNGSGAALLSSGNSISYTPITYSVA